MKKLLIVVLCFLSFLAFSQSDDRTKSETTGKAEPKFSIQANTLLYLLDIAYPIQDEDNNRYMILAEFDFQYMINRYIVLSAEPSFAIQRYSVTGEGYDTNYSANSKIGLLFKPFGTHLKGYNIGIYGKIGWMERSLKKDSLYLNLGVGLESGYTWILKNGFTISLGAIGGGFWSIPSKKNYTTYDWDVNSYLMVIPDIMVNLKLGYSF